MKKINKLAALFTLSVLSSALFAAPKPTMVLVHGALFSSSGWSAVQSQLQNANYNVVTLDVPGRAEDGIAPSEVNLTLAAEKTCKVANLQEGPVVLVGHSQGGAVITKALDVCADKIKGLVFVAAVVPLNGETSISSLSEADKVNFDKDVIFDEKNSVFHINYNGPIKETFMADATPEQYKRALNNMVSEPAKIGTEIMQYPEVIYKAMPKFYIQAKQDKIISIDTQRHLVQKTNFKKIYTMNTSHSPMISQPKELATYLMTIVDNL